MEHPKGDHDGAARPDAGDPDGTVRVAVIGSGPAGVYTCEALLAWADEHGRDIVVDLIDRVPVPFGLLRHGVAPDHPRIKGIARTLHDVLEDPRIRFLGDVEFGRDLTLDDARRHHHAVVVATGALADRPMGVPGEDLAGSHGAAEFVTWYDGHPDADPAWELEADRVAVVGVGNVALDVARMLLRSDDALETTDIPEHVREGFRSGRTRSVTVLGRRGPENARFTPLELRELDHLDGVRIVVDPADLALDDAGRALREEDRHVAKILDRLESWAELQSAAGFADGDAAEVAALDAGERVLRLRFHLAPTEVLGTDGRVSGLRVERTEADGEGGVRGTGTMLDLDVQAVYRAVGYRSVAVEGVPFDADRATIPHAAGRVLEASGGDPVPGLYTAGWVKRGPTGVIGTNRSCAAETVGELTADLDAGLLPAPPEPDPEAVLATLHSRGVDPVDDADRAAIDAAELALGDEAGRERTKLRDRAAMREAVELARAEQKAGAHR